MKEVIISPRVSGVELRWTLKDIDEKKVKQKQLEKAIKEAEGAGVRTEGLSNLKRALFDIMKRTADADLLFDQTTEMINTPQYWSAATGYTNWAVSPQTRLVKKYRDSATGEMKEQLDPHGRKVHESGYTYSDIPSCTRLGDLRRNIQKWEPYRQSKAAAIEVREGLISPLLESEEYKKIRRTTFLRAVSPERSEKKMKFMPRIYESRKLTTKSDPRLLVDMVNNLRKALQRRGTSVAPIGRATGDFFADILKRRDG